MSSDTFGDLLRDYARFPLLTPSQEIELSRSIQRWRQLKEKPGAKTKKEEREMRAGKKARDRLVQSNLRLVIHLSRKYLNRLRHNGLDHIDLVQEGTLGLIRGAELYDGTRGYKFSTYAYWWIRQALSRGADSLDRLCRIPQHQLEFLYKAVKRREAYCQEHGRFPTIDEIAAELGKSPEELSLLIQRNLSHSSLDAVLHEEGTCLMNTITDDDYNDGALFDFVMSEIERLTPQERDIICSVYELDGGKKKTHGELAKEYGVSRERIRQKKEQALKRLRLVLRRSKMFI